jgi:hypothetical protein
MVFYTRVSEKRHVKRNALRVITGGTKVSWPVPQRGGVMDYTRGSQTVRRAPLRGGGLVLWEALFVCVRDIYFV